MNEIADKMFFVVSYGGVGTHMLMPMIRESQWLGHVIRNRKIPHLKHPHHLRIPPSSFKVYGYEGKVKLIYVFGDPINSVLSHFRRRIANKKTWCKHHCMNLQGDYKKFSARWDLKDYLKNGEDLFRLEEHFDNWTNLNRQDIDYELMILKYETAYRHEKEIKAFLETDVPLSFQQRNSDWRSQSDETKAKLLAIYGNLLEKCERFDQLRIVR